MATRNAVMKTAGKSSSGSRGTMGEIETEEKKCGPVSKTARRFHQHVA